MKVKAWQLMVIKRMVRLFEPSEEYLQNCLKEMAEKSNKKQEAIAILTCSNLGCQKIFERPYNRYNATKRKLTEAHKSFCSPKCAGSYTRPLAMKAANNTDRYYHLKIMRRAIINKQ